MPSVTIFNPNPTLVQMSVNNGPQFSVGGATPPDWMPQSPNSGNPGWSNASPAPNTFAPGSNAVSIVPQDGRPPSNLTVDLPSGMPWDSLQLYIFLGGYGDVSWIALNGGQFVNGSVQPHASKSAGEAHKGHKT